MQSDAGIEALLARQLPLDGEELSRLQAIATAVALVPQQSLFVSGDLARHVYLVVDGTLRVQKSLADGRRLVIAFVFGSDFLGLAQEDRYTYGVEAVTPAQLCRFRRQHLEPLLDACPRLRNRLRRTASSELQRAQDRMLLLGRKTADERLASFLLQLAERHERAEGPPHVVPLPMNRRDIADYLGLTTETVSRTFTQFRADGLIDFPDAHRAVLLNLELLRERSGDGLDLPA